MSARAHPVVQAIDSLTNRLDLVLSSGAGIAVYNETLSILQPFFAMRPLASTLVEEAHLALGVASGASAFSLVYIGSSVVRVGLRTAFPELESEPVELPDKTNGLAIRLPTPPKSSESVVVFGEAGTDGGEFTITPELVVASMDALSAGVFIFGAPGTGKTEAAAKRLVEQFLRLQGGRIGLLVLDAKGTLGAALRPIIEAAGREDDVFVIGPSGSPFNVLGPATRTPEQRAEAFIDAVETVIGSGNEDGKWIARKALQILTALIGLEQLARGLATPRSVLDAMNSGLSSHVEEEGGAEELQQAALDYDARIEERFALGLVSEADRERASSYIATLVADGRTNPRNRGTVWDFLREWLASFCVPELRETFSPEDPSTGFPAIGQALAEHRIVLFEPESADQRVAGVTGNLIKLEAQRAAMARLRDSKLPGATPMRDLPHWVFLYDEAHVFLTGTTRPGIGDAPFLAQARETKVANIKLLQGPSQVRAKLGAHHATAIFATVRTVFFFAQVDPEDAAYASKRLAEVWTDTASRSWTQRPRSTRFDPVTAETYATRSSVDHSTTFSEQLRPRFDPVHLMELRPFEAIGSVYDGISQRTVRTYFKPHFAHPGLPYRDLLRELEGGN